VAVSIVDASRLVIEWRRGMALGSNIITQGSTSDLPRSGLISFGLGFHAARARSHRSKHPVSLYGRSVRGRERVADRPSPRLRTGTARQLDRTFATKSRCNAHKRL
jgi:hypothetical protein